MSTYTFHTEQNGVELTVVYRVSPFIPATYWQPAEGGEVEIISITGGDVADEDAIYDEACNRAAQDAADYAADYADYCYEQYRDRQLEDAL